MVIGDVRDVYRKVVTFNHGLDTTLWDMYYCNNIIGVRVRVGPHSTVQTYPYQEECPTGPEQTRRDGRLAHTTGKSASPWYASWIKCEVYTPLYMYAANFLLGLWSERTIMAWYFTRFWLCKRHCCGLHALCFAWSVPATPTSMAWLKTPPWCVVTWWRWMHVCWQLNRHQKWNEYLEVLWLLVSIGKVWIIQWILISH